MYVSLSANVALFREHYVNLERRHSTLSLQRAKMKSVIQYKNEYSLYTSGSDKGESVELGQE